MLILLLYFYYQEIIFLFEVLSLDSNGEVFEKLLDSIKKYIKKMAFNKKWND